MLCQWVRYSKIKPIDVKNSPKERSSLMNWNPIQMAITKQKHQLLQINYKKTLL